MIRTPSTRLGALSAAFSRVGWTGQAEWCRVHSGVSASTVPPVGPPDVDCVVVGAGVVGCAIARAISLRGKEVFLLDKHSTLGVETSSRNSEVIHAGIYYPEGSLKAKLCVEGKHHLYQFCRENGIPHKQIGKLIVATSDREAEKLEEIKAKAALNGVTDMLFLSDEEISTMEPALNYTAALHSPSTGIVDSHSVMVAMQAHLEQAAGTFVSNSEVVGVDILGDPTQQPTFAVRVQDTSANHTVTLHTNMLVNAGGLHAQALAATIDGLPREAIPPLFLARGCYFTSTVKLPFSRLIYPTPVDGGLGVHLTLDLSGAARFGPDVQWVEEIDYKVDPDRARSFYSAIRTYYPELPDGCLVPDYSGIRPKVTGPGQPAGDFAISGPEDHGVSNLVNLFGIESPGLTASLAIGDLVASKLHLENKSH